MKREIADDSSCPNSKHLLERKMKNLCGHKGRITLLLKSVLTYKAPRYSRLSLPAPTSFLDSTSLIITQASLEPFRQPTHSLVPIHAQKQTETRVKSFLVNPVLITCLFSKRQESKGHRELSHPIVPVIQHQASLFCILLRKKRKKHVSP